MNSYPKFPASLLRPSPCFLLVWVLAAALLAFGCAKPEGTLEYAGPSPGGGDAVFPNTSTGQQIRQHLAAMAGVGEDAEANYQNSLASLRANPEATTVVETVYLAVPEQDYFRRTLLVEALKEMRTVEALPSLERIATSPIPEDRLPQNAEIDTREHEVVIRITAVQGLSILADSSDVAHNLLLELVGHEDLTVRQMAARGYLGSSLGNAEEKLSLLRERVPREEHWYLTTEMTEIREVRHPDVLPEYDLDELLEVESDEAPKIEEQR